MKKKILVIDDDSAIRNSFKLTFEDTDVEVQLAENGNDGIKKIMRNNYNIVFLDLKMPGLNGVQVLKEIKKIRPKLLVYIITAFHKEYFIELQDALKDGIEFEIIQKPLNSTQLFRVIDCISPNLHKQ